MSSYGKSFCGRMSFQLSRAAPSIASLLISAVVFLLLLQGCAAPQRLAAVPKDQEAAVETISGMTDVRYWEDNDADVERLWQDRVVAPNRETQPLAAPRPKGP